MAAVALMNCPKAQAAHAVEEFESSSKLPAGHASQRVAPLTARMDAEGVVAGNVSEDAAAQAITEAGLGLSPNSDFAQAKYLSTRAATIYYGTSEVHRNILAHAIGCP